MTMTPKSGTAAARGRARAPMLLLAACFRIQRMMFGRIDGGRRRMRVARARFYQSLWRAAAAATGASLISGANGDVEIRREGLCFKARESETHADDAVALARAGDKLATYRLLLEAGIPIPRHVVLTLGEFGGALAFLQSLGGPVVVKPAAATGGGGGVTTNIYTETQLRSAMSWARTYGKEILVEEQIDGDCYRILLMDGEQVDAILRRPPAVIGDGRSTIAQLLRMENARRIECGAARAQALLTPDRDEVNTLARQGLDFRSRPAEGAAICVKQVVNENALQDNSRVEGVLCADIVATARRSAEAVGVRLAGVDIICRDPSLPLKEAGGAVIEVNGQPGLYYHHVDERGPAVASRILESFFASGAERGQALCDSARAGGTPAADPGPPLKLLADPPR